MKITKKPVTVDGWRVSDLLHTFYNTDHHLPDPVYDAFRDGVVEFEGDRITIATLEGVMTGWTGWWLIMGIKGEFYPCDGDVFRQSYDIGDSRTLLGVVRPPAIGLPPSPSAFSANPEGDR
jgi:hypothetical protein